LAEPTPETARVSTLELFFDLVFVFTVTQLTTLLADHFDLRAVFEVAVMLGIIWWMYGGYAWLTNAVPPHSSNRRLLLLGGMGAYLVIALAIPEAFSGSGSTFALGYLAVILVHATLFSRALQAGNVIAIAPYNLMTGLALVASGIAGGIAQDVVWPLAAVFLWLSPLLIKVGSGFQIAPSHFVERHGLVVIVAIGESIVVIGVAAAGLAVDLSLVLVASVSLALSACLWWTYFGGDDEAAERALATSPPERRPRLALDAFGRAHLLLLFGIIAIAAAQKKAVGHAFDPLATKEALALAGGLAAYLIGDAVFRATLRIGRLNLRLGAALVALATIPLGSEAAAVAQLTALVALMLALFAVESRAVPAVPQA
jgi:low temperature requirement protein LtrA